MKVDDKDKLNKCLDILDSTDLGLSLVWLWTWSTVKNFMDDEEYVFNSHEDEVWEALGKAVESGHGFSLEYGAEQNYEDVRDWLFSEQIMSLIEEEDDDNEFEE